MTQNFSAMALIGLLGLGAQPVLADCNTSPRPAIVISENLPIVDQFSGDIMTELPYYQRIDVLQDFEDRGNIVVRITDPVTQEVTEGITDSAGVLPFFGSNCLARPVTMDDIRLRPEHEGVELQAKAITGLTVRSRLAGEENGNVVRLYAEPSFDARSVSSSQLYSIVFIHAQVTQRVVIDGVEDVETWYYIGPRSVVEFREGDDGAARPSTTRALSGWIHEGDLIFWPQRQSVFLDGPDADGFVYADPSLSQVLATVDYIDETAEDRRNSLLKMLLISDEGNSDEIYRVAVATQRFLDDAPGDAVAADQPLEVISEDDARQRIAERLRNSDQIDLLFVLDNSESMGAYRDAVIDGLLQAVDASDVADRVSVGIAMYGDHFDTLAQAETWAASGPRNGFNPQWLEAMPDDLPFQYWLRDFDRPGAFPSVADLNSAFGGEYSDPQRDREEMGLAALSVAVNTASWRPGSLRLVFYVGDDESRTGVDETLISGVTDTGVILVPINVAGRDIDDFNTRWIAQVNALSTAIEARTTDVLTIPVENAYDAEGGDIAGTRESIFAKVQLVLSFSEVVSQREVGEQTGDLLEEARARALEAGVSPAFIQPEFIDALANTRGEERAALYARYDLISEAFFPQESSRIYVAMTDREIVALQGAMQLACIALGDTQGMVPALREMLEELTEAFLGEGRALDEIGEDESLAEYVAKLAYLPASYFQVFGEDLSIEEFEDFIIEAPRSTVAAIQTEICSSSYLLELVSDGVNIERDELIQVGFDDRRGRPTFAYPDTANTDFDWAWGTEDGALLTFIPAEYFPQGDPSLYE